MTVRDGPDIIGMTAAGQPIIKSTGCCEHFERQRSTLACTQECWYCKYADFRENTALQKNYGVCRLKGCIPSPKLSDDDLDTVVGGMTTEVGQAKYKCECGAVFCCAMTECPICHSTKIRKA